jgi:hypothetical protein
MESHTLLVPEVAPLAACVPAAQFDVVYEVKDQGATDANWQRETRTRRRKRSFMMK